jgi:hypothetical protein
MAAEFVKRSKSQRPLKVIEEVVREGVCGPAGGEEDLW